MSEFRKRVHGFRLRQHDELCRRPGGRARERRMNAVRTMLRTHRLAWHGNHFQFAFRTAGQVFRKVEPVEIVPKHCSQLSLAMGFAGIPLYTDA
jgi:hypothetical protein